ncbi:hypothetical protein POSPLADRAFT_1050243 [Postia placenta MAD-698-R-SB12]|uniref:Fe2OG dioxygenase domain-containing protein n=1 Tax=Postia placenta MAD-698-R-SB12 TaxID=670580 RepID=A0A1X6MLG5_9APHY|nr:hypothetical protein POSPLADRAFT_1050243 [Postia placenta MAD-698-R-SB12]OSX57200.1 hypothetical protein POSPLADRAFT_1050243 [Postia placenta MAD-698-R-SB12]
MSLIDAACKAESEACSHIPIIDLQNIPGVGQDPSLRRSLSETIRDACMNVGFFYVSNHGIPSPNIHEAYSAAKDYFSLPLEEKMELDLRQTPNFKGYNPVRSSNNDPDNDGDMHEGFEFSWEDLNRSESVEERTQDGAMAGANVWPKHPPGFREAALTYYHAAVELGRKLFPLFALALELPEDYFDDKTKSSAAIMRILHYPPQTGPVDDRCFTILWQEPGIQALQVLTRQGQWIDAPPIPGTLVINLGDQFARWTNDVFKSTVHRAINRSGVRRYSIPLFFGTDYDVKLEPIPSCVSADRPQKYEVVTAGDYVKSRLVAAYGH